ncbi:MAG: NAD(P)H-dependent oxidoreductase [Chitinophagales bacterium]|nr:NAD(P)H-dependent oxidoreductase [Chitinophagales bacterium]MDW8417930.1 NAD(P)H-dependent oxidoreductase [Chitinophagales bacterium]
MKITIISGSPRKASITVRVAKYLCDYFPQKYPAHHFDYIQLNEVELPFIQEVWSTLADVPDVYKKTAEKIFGADAFVLVTPEYNGSMSSAIRNLFDHFPKQHRKVFGIVTASEGALGGIRAAVAMQNQICAWFGIPSPHMLTVSQMTQKFSDDGKLLDEKFLHNIMTFTHEFIWLAEAVYQSKTHPR